MSDLNKKLDNILNILTKNKKQYRENFQKLNDKIDNNILHINNRIDEIEKKIKDYEDNNLIENNFEINMNNSDKKDSKEDNKLLDNKNSKVQLLSDISEDKKEKPIKKRGKYKKINIRVNF